MAALAVGGAWLIHSGRIQDSRDDPPSKNAGSRPPSQLQPSGASDGTAKTDIDDPAARALAGSRPTQNAAGSKIEAAAQAEPEPASQREGALSGHVNITDGAPSGFLTPSQRRSQQAGKALEPLRKAIIQRELRRAVFETGSDEEFSYARVVISQPAAAEIQELKTQFQNGARELPEDVRPYYFVDGQRLLDKYLHFTHPFIVLLADLPFHGEPRQDALRQDGVGLYRVFHTSDPSPYRFRDGFMPDKNGYRIIVPDGVIPYDVDAWIDKNGNPPARYRHLFAGLK